MKHLVTAAVLSLMVGTTTSAGPSVYTPPLMQDSVFSELGDGTRIHAIEAGEGESIVLLHGLPASAYLWRHVVPKIAESHHVVAPDLPGYGHSSAVASGDFGLAAASTALEQYLNGLAADKLTLVVTDIGSVLGLNYAVKNPDRIAGIVLSEAVFQPPQEFMAQIRPEHHEFIMAAQDADFVQSITLDQPVLVDMAMQNNSVIELSEEVLANYRGPYYPPFEDHADKRMTLNAVFGPEGMQNFGMMAAENAAGLAEMDVPILLVVAEPGYMVNAPAVAYAKANFQNLSIAKVEDAGHFFAEDNPEGFASAVLEWLENHP